MRIRGRGGGNGTCAVGDAIGDDTGQGLDGALRREDEPAVGAAVAATDAAAAQQVAKAGGGGDVEPVRQDGHKGRVQAGGWRRRRGEEVLVGVARGGPRLEQQHGHGESGGRR